MVQLANFWKIMWACSAHSRSLSSLESSWHEVCSVGRLTLSPAVRPVDFGPGGWHLILQLSVGKLF